MTKSYLKVIRILTVPGVGVYVYCNAPEWNAAEELVFPISEFKTESINPEDEFDAIMNLEAFDDIELNAKVLGRRTSNLISVPTIEELFLEEDCSAFSAM